MAVDQTISCYDNEHSNEVWSRTDKEWLNKLESVPHPISPTPLRQTTWSLYICPVTQVTWTNVTKNPCSHERPGNETGPQIWLYCDNQHFQFFTCKLCHLSMKLSSWHGFFSIETGLLKLITKNNYVWNIFRQQY